MMQYYKKLVLSFIMFKCNEYSRCTYLFLSQLRYWENEVPQLFNFIKDNYSVFDEEQGEISLSILARITALKPIHTDIHNMNKYYIFQSIYKDDGSQSHYYNVAKISDPIITKLVCFLD
jgi:hypothetical protein